MGLRIHYDAGGKIDPSGVEEVRWGQKSEDREQKPEIRGLTNQMFSRFHPLCAFSVFWSLSDSLCGCDRSLCLLADIVLHDLHVNHDDEYPDASEPERDADELVGGT